MHQGSPAQQKPSMNIGNPNNISSSATSVSTAPQQQHMSTVSAAPQQIQPQQMQASMSSMAQVPGGVYQQSSQQVSQQQQPPYQVSQQYQKQPLKHQHQFPQQVSQQQPPPQSVPQQVHTHQAQPNQQYSQMQQLAAPQQQQQQQQPQQAPAQLQILTGGWQSERDMADRRKMIAKIVLLLQQRKPNAPQEWLKKLPQMAKRLEESLYRSAASFEVYNDMNTLKFRLQQLAMNIGMKTQQMKNQQGKPRIPPQPVKAQQPQPVPQSSSVVVQGQQYQPQPQVSHQPQLQQQTQQPYQVSQSQQQPQQQQQSQPIAAHTYAYQSQSAGSHPQQVHFPQQQIIPQQKLQFQTQPPQQPAPSQPQNRIVNLNEINSYMTPSNAAQQQTIQQTISQPQRPPMTQQVTMPPLPLAQQLQPQQQRQQLYGQVQQQTSQQFTQRPQQIQMPQAPTSLVGQQQQVQHHAQLQPLQQVQPLSQQAQPLAQQIQPLSQQLQPLPQQVQPISQQVQALSQQVQPISQQVQALPQQIQMAAAPASSVPGNPTSATSAVQSSAAVRSASDRQQVLRHQQQRLLLLRHAAKCPHEDNRCPVTPHCAGMKRLWKHIAECKDQKCLVPHCVSSRYVLSHYHRCRDVKCPVCGPVREAIHRSHEKAKMLQKQREQQQAEGAANQPIHQQPQPALVATQFANVQAVQPFPPQVLQEVPHQQVTQEPIVQQVQHPVIPPPLQAPISTVQHQPQPASSSKRQKTTASAGGSRKSTPANPGYTVPTQPQHFPTPIQHQQQMQPGATPIQAVSQIMTPTPVDPDVQKSNSVPENNSVAQQGSVYSQPTITASAPIAPVTSTAVSTPGVAPQLVNGQVIMPKHEGPKPQEDHTLINSFSIEQIETHITSLSTGLNVPPAKLKAKCGDVLKTLQNHQHAWVFNSPVDPVELGLPDYFQIIKRPMDLGTIKKRLENGCYHSVGEFQSDVLLTFDNAMLYNQEGSVVHNMAKEMKDLFVLEHDKLMNQLHAEEEEKRKNGDACSLCGCEKLLFEPPVFYCNGLSCPNPGKRIRRNSYFYVNKNNQYHWCPQCWGELSEKPIEVGDVIIKKNELTKKKNDEIHEESWVQCDKCERWIHQICALFNTRQNKDQRSEYVCPSCTIEDRRKRGVTEGISTTPMAEDLPRTKLSEWLENHVRLKVKEKLEELSREVSVTPSEEGGSIEPIKAVTMGGNITIRQVTSMDRKLEVRERMRSRYGFKKYPSEFPFRCKCIVVFQNLDGVDVILFGLYVYEHGADSPPPNHRAVYISYLDSVHYMRPRKMRTFIYHEILISYLDYVRNKGFLTAHIWACPPLKGDDYILYAKPEDQKTPKDDRLRQWYIDMLIEAQKRDIVGKLTNMYDLYFADERNDATVVPYMDGDYFPAEVENVIKDIEEGKGSKSSDSGKKNKKKAKAKQKGNRGGTRSTGLDEDALKASGILPLGIDSKSLEEGARDFVMKKVGETIQPMKESFIVAFLNSTSPEKHTNNEPNAEEMQTDYKSQEKASDIKMLPSTTDAASSSSSTRAPLGCKPDQLSTEKGLNTDSTEQVNCEPILSHSNGVVAAPSLSIVKTENNIDSKVTFLRKRDADGDIKPVLSSSPSINVIKEQSGKVIKIVDDDEEEMDCEFLNNRQAFLNLCQGNHYQFDQLRRAKHTSMMVLWHLHNRDAPKFVQQCASCSREILTGYRYHCQSCPDFDQCQECYNNPNTVRHHHPLTPTPVGGQQSQLTEAQRQERQRHIQLHMQLLQHAATCNSPNCPSGNCIKMKGLLRHGSTCTVKHTGGCNVCKRIWALLQIHARQCKLSSCAVPNCMAIRERIRQLTKQQQAMDDRRRQEMNRTYRAAGSR